MHTKPTLVTWIVLKQFSISSRNPHHRYTFINSKYTSPYFLNFPFCIKITYPASKNHTLLNLGPSETSSPSRFSAPLENLQSDEISLLEKTHGWKIDHKQNKLIQNNQHDFTQTPYELKINKALEYLRPLLRIRNIRNVKAN